VSQNAVTNNTPDVEISLTDFHADPYPVLKSMRQSSPICFVPQLDATLLTLHGDVVRCERNVDVFSSEQPDGLMAILMGENMMRKDGEAHQLERRQALPSLSPRTVKRVWKQQFENWTDKIIETLSGQDTCDLVQDYAMPVSAHALRVITGLTNMTPVQLDACSQGMINGIANYAGDKSVEHRCTQSTELIDRGIDEMLEPETTLAPQSLLKVLTDAQQPMESIRANIKLAISGGQNEPRDAIAGCVWALLTHPAQRELLENGTVSYQQVFEEYVRWISPIGMSPRRIAKSFSYNSCTLLAGSKAFLMFGSANRDETVFDHPDQFDVTRNTTKSVSFGKGPHFCAGAAASRALIAEVALPKLFSAFPKMEIDGDVSMQGWAFRGPVSLPVRL